MNKMMTIEVAYAKADEQCILEVKIAEGSTIESVITSSKITTLFPEIDLTKQKIGIFGKPCRLQEFAKEGDRIEIYRSLIIDPKEARRTKAKFSPPKNSL